MDFRIFTFFINLARPLDLLGGILVYALGVGIARYLGYSIDWAVVTLGQAWVTTYQLGFHFLSAYFLQPTKPGDENRILITADADNEGSEIRRELILWTAFTPFAVATTITLILMMNMGVNYSVLILQGIILLGAILYCVPPFQVVYSGYGDIIRSIIIANLIPALAFMLQTDSIHRLVGMSTFPLTMLFLSKLLAVQLRRFYRDSKLGNETLLVRLGWERGMTFHNLLILSAYLLVGASMLFGLPSRVAMPVFFVLPLGFFQIWYITRIAAGAKPNWRILRFTAILTFGMTAYLFAFSFWIQ
jgi:1,4-dihydroxy-2-naphthoate octaprenyltransferase